MYYRSFFPDYREYAQKIYNIINNHGGVVDPIPNINAIPEEAIFYSFNNENDFKCTISKRKTDIYYFPQGTKTVFNNTVEKFYKIISKYVENVLNDYITVSKIGVISTSFIGMKDPVKSICETFTSFTKIDFDQINLDIKKTENVEGIKLNNIFSVFNHKFVSNDGKQTMDAIGLNAECNSDGFLLNIEKDQIRKIIDSTKKIHNFYDNLRNLTQ